MSESRQNASPDDPGAGFLGYLRHEVPSLLLWSGGIALVLTLLFGFVSSPRTPRQWAYAFLFSFIISLCIGFFLTTIYRLVQPRVLERFPGRVAYWATHAVIIPVAVFVGVEVSIRIIERLGGPSLEVLRRDVTSVGLVVSVVIVGAVVVYERLRDRARRVELRAQQVHRQALAAQLAALQARVNPHFLFNSLNTVAGLIEEDPDAAERMLLKLSGLFRYSLEGSKTTWVRLAQELSAVRDYLEVETMRLGERLRSEIEAEAGVESLLVPPLTLQPLVENAVLHAVAPRKAGGWIKVRARRNHTSLELSVRDDGPGLGHSPHRGSGTSLSDLEERLRMAYAGEAKLERVSDPSGGFCVRLTLPLRADS